MLLTPNKGLKKYQDSDAFDYNLHNDNMDILDAASVVEKLAYKAANESVVSSAVLQDDDHLFIPMLANETWLFDGWIYFGASTVTPDVALAFTVPAGATLGWNGGGSSITGTDLTAAALNIAATDASGTSAGYGTGTGRVAIPVKGFCSLGATPGNLQLRWAQRVSDASAVTMIAGSWLYARKKV